jgi:hypothetical protein
MAASTNHAMNANGSDKWRRRHHTTEAKRTPDMFARTLELFENGLRRILADERKEGDR